MKIKFEFATVSDVLEQSVKLMVLSLGIALVNYLIGDESGIVGILAMCLFFVSQFIRLVSFANRIQTAMADIQSALPSLELGREDIESVEALIGYIDDSLDKIENKYKAELEAQINNVTNKNIDLRTDLTDMTKQLSEKDRELEDAKRALKQAWEDKKSVLEQGRGDVQRLKTELESERERYNLLRENTQQMEGLEVFLSGDNEAIRAKYMSIVNSNNAKKSAIQRTT